MKNKIDLSQDIFTDKDKITYETNLQCLTTMLNDFKDDGIFVIGYSDVYEACGNFPIYKINKGHFSLSIYVPNLFINVEDFVVFIEKTKQLVSILMK